MSGVSNLLKAPNLVAMRYVSSRRLPATNGNTSPWSDEQLSPNLPPINGELACRWRTSGRDGNPDKLSAFPIAATNPATTGMERWTTCGCVRAFDAGEVKALLSLPPTNFVPLVYAGADMTVQPINPVNLAGEVADDARPSAGRSPTCGRSSAAQARRRLLIPPT